MRRTAALLLLAAAATAQRIVPTPPPPQLSKTGGVCNAYCCSLDTRQECCADAVTQNADACPFGPTSGYCSWTGSNRCERNCYPREGPCAEVELCFNLTAELSQVALDDFAALVAGQVVWLLGSLNNSMVPVSATQDGLTTIVLRCPDGGCGTLEEIATKICFVGATVPGTGGHFVRKAVGGKCLDIGPNGPTVDLPLPDLAGEQPLRVTARGCDACVPNVTHSDVSQGDTQIAPQSVVVPTTSPAFTDLANFDWCLVPNEFQGLFHYRYFHAVGSGSTFNITCPDDCQACDAYVVHYHDPPCSSDINGNFPALLRDDGWLASSCSPHLCTDSAQYGTVAYRKQILGGSWVETPPVGTDCLKFFGIFVGPGVDCEANELQEEGLCVKAGGLCRWKDGACVTDYCPPPPPSENNVTENFGPGNKTNNPCVPIPGATCPETQAPGVPLPR